MLKIHITDAYYSGKLTMGMMTLVDVLDTRIPFSLESGTILDGTYYSLKRSEMGKVSKRSLFLSQGFKCRSGVVSEIAGYYRLGSREVIWYELTISLMFAACVV